MLLCTLNREGTEKFGPRDCQGASFEGIYKEKNRLVGRACVWYSRDDVGFGL